MHKTGMVRTRSTLRSTTKLCPVCSTSMIRNIRHHSTSTNQKAWRNLIEQDASRIKVSLQDWHRVDLNILDEKTKELVNIEFKGSMYRALSSLFPEKEWQPWKFQQERLPSSFWKEQSNQRKFFEDLGKKLGIQTLDDWYEKLSLDILLDNGALALARQYNKSAMAALMAAYPEHNWIPWKFNNVPRHYWNDNENQRRFFDGLAKELGVRTSDDWYQKLSAEALNKYGARGLLNQYQGSPMAALMAAYPEHNWIPWKFNNVPRNYWKDINNQRTYMDDLGKQLGVKELDDWYGVFTPELLAQHDGKALRNIYQGSAYALLKATYPEHNWIPWKLKPRRLWDSKDNVKQFLVDVSEKLSIQTLDDWYRVDVSQLSRFGAGRLLMKYNGLYNILKEQYPNHPWDPKRFQHGGKKGQRWLAVTLKKMFPNEEVLEDYMHPKVCSSLQRPMQLDVFIPARSLAFEYQGQQHYEEVNIFSPTKTYQQRDEEKRNLCAANNIKLIEVPYWWNRTPESLQEMMSKS